MRAKRAVDIIAIELRDANQNEARISRYLRGRQAQGNELKTEVMLAVMAFFETCAMAEDPLCSAADLRNSWIRSLNLLSGQMSYISSLVEQKIPLSSDSWRRFGLLESSFSTGSMASLSSPTPTVRIPQAIEPVGATLIPSTGLMDDDDDDDDDLSNEEYLAKIKGRTKTDIAVITNN
jgi:hypothetical protein